MGELRLHREQPQFVLHSLTCQLFFAQPLAWSQKRKAGGLSGNSGQFSGKD
jgi:hypothetical protein